MLHTKPHTPSPKPTRAACAAFSLIELLVILTPWSSGLPVVNSDFGRPNQSAMTYLDGHANLIEILPNQTTGDGYTFTFDLD